ncbi:MAG: ATP-binding protein [Planctomycetales bacterium]|nr:ATP-binding protein [Planctomycetales bacterium]
MPTLTKDITVPNHTRSLSEVRSFVAEAVHESALSRREKDLVVLAADEALTSIIHHAHAAGRDGTCHVTVDVDDVRVRILIDDSGRDFDMGAVSDEDLRSQIEKARQYEMGIFLLRAILDEINYTFRKGFQNQLELVKFVYANRR